MNNTIKCISIFGIGAAVGALLATIVTKKRYEDIVQEELDSIHEAQEAKKEREEQAATEEKVLVMSKDKYKKVARNYGKTSDLASEMAEENFPEDKPPYVISLEQFSEGALESDTLYYYEEDDTLADTQEEQISDYVDLIGEDVLDRFGEKSEDPDIVYVRNEKMGIDYEVILLHKSFKERYSSTDSEGAD
jgi:predicted ATPase with chaperone activity